MLDSSCIRNFEGTHGRVCIVSLVGKDLSYPNDLHLPFEFFDIYMYPVHLVHFLLQFHKGKWPNFFFIYSCMAPCKYVFDKRSLNWWWVDKKILFHWVPILSWAIVLSLVSIFTIYLLTTHYFLKWWHVFRMGLNNSKTS